MASVPLDSTDLGVHQSKITKPSPLRIIKRSQTVSGSSTSDDSISGRRTPSGGSFRIAKSPPMSKDGPLTIHKMRKGRGSVWSDTSESGRIDRRATIFDTPQKISVTIEDNDLTPKPNTNARNASVGAFLKAELHRGADIADGYHSLRVVPRYTEHRPQLLEQWQVPARENVAAPVVPTRRVSKSKNLFLRAFPSREESSSKLSRSESTTSKNTLIRRISMRRDASYSSYCSSYDGSEDTASTAHSTQLFSRGHVNPGDLPMNHSNNVKTEKPQYQYISPHLLPSNDVLVLHPHIMVTPEVSTIEAGMSLLWVAITVTGILLPSNGAQQYDLNNATSCNISQYSDEYGRYGKLHSMRIDLHPGQGCTVLEVIGNLHESKVIVPGQTHLILAKIRVGKVEVGQGEVEPSTDGMIAHLQNHLGDTISSYLTVRLTYKHSGFFNHKPIDVDGMRLRLTRIESEATATIKRRNPESAWSPRASRTISNPISLSPIVVLIENHLSREKAVEVKKRLIDDRSKISVARTLGRWSDSSTEHSDYVADVGEIGSIDSTLKGSVQSSSSVANRKSLESLLPSSAETEEPLADDIDPARKIWTEMRMTSKGGRHHQARGSLDADFSYRDEEDEVSPLLTGADNTTPKRQKSKSAGAVEFGHARDERDRIMNTALKNKRSVGTETLRSIAPSVDKVDGRSKRASVTGGGVGAGRGWGWSSWW